MKKLYQIASISLLYCLLSSHTITAQNLDSQNKKEKSNFFSSFVLSGDIQTNMLLAENDSAIDAVAGDKPFKSNSYVRLALKNDYIESGIRAEYMRNPLPGYEANFAGSGIGHIYVRGMYKFFDITAGDFYEQFGNGLIFRAYEERSLGIDNSLRGGRVILKPYKGISIKALGGSQRYYFHKRNNLILGSDIDLGLDQMIPTLQENNWNLSLGGSFISKSEPDEIIMVNSDQRLNLPERVGAFSGRMNLQKSGFVLSTEYAKKVNDPSFDNNYIYKDGNALLVSTSYSQRGMSILLQAKRNENMSFRSSRSRGGIASFINHLPPFSMQHSHTLAAHYPYATQFMGEWAFQSEFRYNFKRRTTLGGKYGTDMRMSFSHIRGLFDEADHIGKNNRGQTGYKPAFFEMSKELYYQDFNIDISKKVNSLFSFNLLYMNQFYNQRIVEGHGNNGDIVHSNIFASELKFNFNRKTNLRTELQYLHTKQDEGDWLYGAAELSLFSNWMIGVSDTYNSGLTKTHYPMITSTYSYHSHRIQLGYGRTREGINCAGGVCRMVPASRGFNIAYNYNF